MITVEHLTKCYGDFMAVSDLSFEIDEGHVYGFLGPNGAGKSTTMNIMTGCLSATEGHVRVDGHDIFEEPEQAKKQIGYLPEMPPLYMNETPVEYLRFVGEAKGLKGQELTAQIEEVIDQAGIREVKGRLISKLSKGYRQRVGIAQALLGNPKVIILDEPTVGLDPIQIIEIRDLIQTLGKSHTVILSSHILSEVQAICDRILIISKGKLVAFDGPQNLERLLLSSNEIQLTTETDAGEIQEILGSLDSISGWEICGAEGDRKISESVTEESVTGEPEGDSGADKGNHRMTVRIQISEQEPYKVCRQLFFAFAEKGRAIFEISAKRASLEEVFIELTEGEEENPAVGETEYGIETEYGMETGMEYGFENEPGSEMESEIENESEGGV